MSRSSSGVFSINKHDTKVFRSILFPLPVAPAINKWGIFAKSVTIVSPPVPFPNAIGRLAFERRLLNSSLSRIDLSDTILGDGLGTSIPTSERPKAGDSILILLVFNANARSLSRFRIVSTVTRVLSSSNIACPFSSFCPVLRDFTTQPGSCPYIVTVGPGLINPNSTSTLL